MNAIYPKNYKHIPPVWDGMPIKSCFFPKEALQGQDIPSHILWNDFTFDYLKITHTKNLTFKEAYNVSKDNLIVHDNSVIIRQVEVDGYLGIIFYSKILPKKSEDDKIEFSFYRKDEIIESMIFFTHLFRQDIRVIETPSEITVNPISGNAEPKICIRNFGKGTAIVEVDITEDSKIEKKHPKFLMDFVESTIERIDVEMMRLRRNFPEFDSLISKIEAYSKQPVEFEKKSMITFNEFESQFTSIHSRSGER